MTESLAPGIEGFLSDVDLEFLEIGPEKRDFRNKVRIAVRKKATAEKILVLGLP